MKLVMVDLDGTLFDTREVNYRAYKEALEQFEYKLDRDYYYAYCNGLYYGDFLPQITTDDEELLTSMHKIKIAAYKKYIKYAKLNNQLLDMLILLKQKCKLALVTTASNQNTWQILEEFALEDLFDFVITKEDVSNTKPNPECYLKALEISGIDKQDAVVFEDSEVGVEAARRAGVACFKIEV